MRDFIKCVVGTVLMTCVVLVILAVVFIADLRIIEALTDALDRGWALIVGEDRGDWDDYFNR